METPTLRALLLGIDEYPFLSTGAQLAGCQNDATAMAELLAGRFGFTDVVKLLGKDATREGIRGALSALLERTQKDDLVVLYYSGHGDELRPPGERKQTGYSESLVAYDSKRGGSVGEGDRGDLTDAELQRYLKQLTERASFVTLIFDCCHASSVHRSSEESAAQVLPIPTPSTPTSEAAVVVKERPRPDRYVLLAACREDETAKSGSQHSPFTAGLLSVLQEAPADATYRDVFEATVTILAGVACRLTDQHPVCEGAWERELFGSKAVPRRDHAQVRAVDGNTLTLDRGSSLGVRLESEWALHPATVTEPELSSLPRAVVEDVSATESRARLLDDSASIDPGYRAIQVLPPNDNRWSVALRGVPDPPAAKFASRAPEAQIYGLIKESPWLRLASSEESPTAIIHLLAKRDAVDADTPVPQLGKLAAPKWAAVDPNGYLLLQPRETYENKGLRDNLELLVRRQLVLKLTNPLSQIQGQIELRVFRNGAPLADAPQPSAEAAQQLTLSQCKPGDKLRLEVENKLKKDCFFSLLFLDADGSIKRLYTPPGATERLAAGQTRVFTESECPELHLRWPDAKVLPIDAAGRPRIIAIKLLASADYIDLRPLTQGTIRLTTPTFAGEKTLLGRLLLTTLSGTALKRGRDTQLSDKEEWTALTQTLELTP